MPGTYCFGKVKSGDLVTYTRHLTRCPINAATIDEWECIEAGRLHACDARVIDIDNSSHDRVIMMLYASAWAREMAFAKGLSTVIGAMFHG